MSNYYEAFDKLTDGGYIYDIDLSSEEVSLNMLTEEEQTERQKWNQQFEEIRKNYGDNSGGPRVTSVKMLMQQRLLPPKLKTDGVTTRTRHGESRDGRMYPPPTQMKAWSSFVGHVSNYEPPDKGLQPMDFKVFEAMMEIGRRECRSERDEEAHLLYGLEYLVYAEIVKEIKKETGAIGKPDFVMFGTSPAHGDEIMSVIGESKSTHNLLLPNNTRSLVKKYKDAYKKVIQQGKERTVEWCHIGHPIAQLLGYMVDNKRRYGALTSGTHTYFICIEGQENDAMVNISEPYFLGEVNYLRAWAYMHSLGCKQTDEFVPPTEKSKLWLRTTKDNPQKKQENLKTEKKRSRGGDRKQSGSGKRSKTTKSATLHLPLVDFQVLEIGEELGFGRNGSVFKAIWGECTVALKQFDIGKDGQIGYERELAAYARTKDAWGKLVPEPLFLSETPSGGVKFLGLQLGRSLEGGVKVLKHQWDSILVSLEEEFGIRHNDAEGRSVNAIVVNDNGCDRLVAIDFEDWDDLWA